VFTFSRSCLLVGAASLGLAACSEPEPLQKQDLEALRRGLTSSPHGYGVVGLVPKVPTLSAPNPVTTVPDCQWSTTLYSDDEDSANANDLVLDGSSFKGRNHQVGGLSALISDTKAGGNTSINCCHEEVWALPRTRARYAVLAGRSAETQVPFCGRYTPVCPMTYDSAGNYIQAYAFTRLIDSRRPGEGGRMASR
jgi:hypothetical protein